MRRPKLHTWASAALTLALIVVSPAAEALAQAGGGSSGFSSGGGSSSGGSGSGGGGSSGGGSGGELNLPLWLDIVLVLVIVVIALVVLFVGRKQFLARLSANPEARAILGPLVDRTFDRLSRRKRAERAARVQAAAAEAADDDPAFAADTVRAEGTRLFLEAQRLWDQRDAARLAEIVAPDLMIEWERRLEDFEAKGWHNRVRVLGDPQVDYVGLVNRERDDEDRAVVSIAAGLESYVVTREGRKIRRTGQLGDTIAVREYWTLAKRDGRWILASIEQALEGEHHLDAPLVATPWADRARLSDEAITELAVADGLPEDFKPADVAELDFDVDARAAALDLALADPRFSPDVLEAAARRAVEAWAEAVDGDDVPLEAVAHAEAVSALLYGADASRRTRLVVRGPRVKRIRIVALDAGRDPATMTIDVELGGRRYVEDRDTAAVLSGNKDRATTFTERWTLALDGDKERPWRIAEAGAQARPARTSVSSNRTG